VSVRAVLFDFNGTLSNDEPILCEIYVALFGELGLPLSAQEYYDHLAGLSDEEIMERWLGSGYPDGLIAERIRRYRDAVSDGSTVGEAVRAAVRYAAERVPVAIVSGAAREEIEPVVAAAGLSDLFATVVPADDVRAGKPDPEGYLLALARLGLDADGVVALEDTEAGVASAKGAGLRCLGVLGTLAPGRLAAADELVAEIDVDVMRRLLAD
jgi:beta-phosphoglucomutase